MKYQVAILLRGSDQVWKFEVPKGVYSAINGKGIAEEGLLEFEEVGGMNMCFKFNDIQGILCSKIDGKTTKVD